MTRKIPCVVILHFLFAPFVDIPYPKSVQLNNVLFADSQTVNVRFMTNFFVGDYCSAETKKLRSSLLPCLLTRIHSLWHVGFCCFLRCTGNIKVCIGNEVLKRSRRKLVLPPGDLTRVCSSLTPEGSALAAVIESCSHQFFLCQTNDGRVTYPKQKLYSQIFFLLHT